MLKKDFEEVKYVRLQKKVFDYNESVDRMKESEAKFIVGM